MTDVPIKRKEDREREREREREKEECHLETKTVIGVMMPQTKEWLGPQKARR